jgi:glycosyltransferase involved in cell wall biosynthesis
MNTSGRPNVSEAVSRERPAPSDRLKPVVVAPVSVVVLTYNEERNLAACLESVAGWAARMFVVDSGSTDRTISIANQFGAEVFSHTFESHARQWQWALSTLPLDHVWVLALDADQALTAQLREDIALKLPRWTGSDAPAGAYVNRRQIFRGRWIRHGGYYPKYLLKLFRRDAVSIDVGDRVDHHFRVAGQTAILDGDLIEDNLNENDISNWIAKHNRYAALQASEEEARSREASRGGRFFGTPDDCTLWQKRVWNRLPLYVRPFAYFFYRYAIRLGFLDGKEGFIFHFMQALWYRLLVDINRDEQRRTAGGQRADARDAGSPDRSVSRAEKT